MVASVYGDDFTTVGSQTQLDWFVSSFRKRYKFTEQARLGPGPEDSKEAMVLNRLVLWTLGGFEYEADPRQRERLMQDLSLSRAKPVGTPGAKLTNEQMLGDKGLAAKK